MAGEQEGKTVNDVTDELIESEPEEEGDVGSAGEPEARSGPDEGVAGVIYTKVVNEVTDDGIESEPEEISGAGEPVDGDEVMETVKEQDVGPSEPTDEGEAVDGGVEIEEEEQDESLARVAEVVDGGVEIEEEEQDESLAREMEAVDGGVEEEEQDDSLAREQDIESEDVGDEQDDSEDETFCMSDEGLHEEEEPTVGEGEEEAQRGSEIPVLVDDGRRRYRLVERLRFYSSELSANEDDGPDEGQQAEKEGSQKGNVGQKKRNKVGGKEKPQVRGPHRGRGPSEAGNRPRLVVVGDGEFAATPKCKKIVTTIRLLTLEYMPGPFRSYNLFPVDARLRILRQFLRRYSWEHGQDVGRCIDVFEAIAADAYSRQLTVTRRSYLKKFGDNKETWSENQPRWCKNNSHWRGLCDIWEKEGWKQQSVTNKANRTKHDPVVHHVGGSRSFYKHKSELVSTTN